MRTFKNTAIALLTSLGVLTSGSLATAQPVLAVSQSIEKEAKAIASLKSDPASRFNKVSELSSLLNELNHLICSPNYQCDKTEFTTLLLVNDFIDLSFKFLTREYEELIYTTYLKEFRAFSSERSAFKSNLKQLQEKQEGIKIVHVKGLSLTETDLKEISREANKWVEERL